jgi:hypothetical protein
MSVKINFSKVRLPPRISPPAGHEHDKECLLRCGCWETICEECMEYHALRCPKMETAAPWPFDSGDFD